MPVTSSSTSADRGRYSQGFIVARSNIFCRQATLRTALRLHFRTVRPIRPISGAEDEGLHRNQRSSAAVPNVVQRRNHQEDSFLLRAAFCLLLFAAILPVQAQREVPVVSEHGSLYCSMRVQDSLPVRTMLESGIPFPLIDSALVWAHPALFRPEKLDRPLRFRMASGALYEARYKLPPGLRAGDSRSLCACYVVDLERRSEKLLYPLQCFTTDSLDAPGIFTLDLRGGLLRMLREEELPQPGAGWRICDLRRDERTGMYCVTGDVSFGGEREGGVCGRMELIVDLGNANLLALFTSKPRAGELVDRSGVPRQAAENRSGRRFEVLLPGCINLLDACAFEGFPVLLLDGPVRLPGDGFLGVRFFERFRAVFDFRHRRLLLAPRPG